jgi:hypothetical protein
MELFKEMEIKELEERLEMASDRCILDGNDVSATQKPH